MSLERSSASSPYCLLTEGALVDRGVQHDEYTNLSVIEQLNLLTPKKPFLEKIICGYNLPIVYRSTARLYRIFGRMPTDEEMRYDLIEAENIEVQPDQIRDWRKGAHLLIESFVPYVKEQAVHTYGKHRWLDCRNGNYLEMDDYISEAIKVLEPV